ncbi:hypothetical protein NG895_19655 [Aeoliella sp. ICT_H6.2]|uniref:Uncharacterized protein n=1 Tax=Aeoliella straminimaris TaxID=2954799 RepID=A0A9X2JI39_9BACT|nr:hypothetical protein [Aeoliella straminimaris]MCO6046122.1 hypothetical protein [Aeoliella straminimaris]
MQSSAEHGEPAGHSPAENPYASAHAPAAKIADNTQPAVPVGNGTAAREVAAVVLGVLVILLCLLLGVVCSFAEVAGANLNPHAPVWVNELVRWVVGPTMLLLAGVATAATLLLALRMFRRN